MNRPKLSRNTQLLMAWLIVVTASLILWLAIVFVAAGVIR